MYFTNNRPHRSYSLTGGWTRDAFGSRRLRHATVGTICLSKCKPRGLQGVGLKLGLHTRALHPGNLYGGHIKNVAMPSWLGDHRREGSFKLEIENALGGIL